jgi:excisionase family DNA binding protein
MVSVEIRFVVAGKEVSLGSFAEAIITEVRSSVREEIGRVLNHSANRSLVPEEPIRVQGQATTERTVSTQKSESATPPKAVSISEAARLLSISPRTLYNCIAMNAIRTIHVGRRVLIPMKSINEVASRGVPWRRSIGGASN